LIETDFSLTHPDSLKVSCTIRLPAGKQKLNPIIVGHGFRGFKDWGFFPYLCKHLSNAGFAVVSFNHALSGISNNLLEIDDIESFSKNSTTQELLDWRLVMDNLLWGDFPYIERLRLNALGIVGHSRGGSYGILFSRQIVQIQSIVTWGAIKTFERFDSATCQQWKREGILRIGSTKQGRPLELKVKALEDLENNLDQLDVIQAIRQLSIPALILHGRNDKVVSLSEAKQLWKCSDQKLSAFHIIEGSGHTFHTQHPLVITSPALKEAVDKTISWFKNTLSSKKYL